MNGILPILKHFFAELRGELGDLVLSDRIRQRLDTFLAQYEYPAENEQAVRRLLRGCVQIIFAADAAYAILRPGVGLRRIVRLHPESTELEEVDRDEFLRVLDSTIQGAEQAAQPGLVLDFAPFFRDFPRVTEASEMGEGISLLNRRLAGQMYQNPALFHEALLQFLRDAQLERQTILVNDHLSSVQKLRTELALVRGLLEELDPQTPYAAVAHELRTHGFEVGWGRTVADIARTLGLLAQVFDHADPVRFERLLERLPLIRTVLMVSPHGWFAQEGVLGKPDTGGQVTYVLDQVRAFEHRIREHFAECGVEATPKVLILTRLVPNAQGTTCNVAREKVHGTQDSWIIRAPFRDASGEVLPHWISRFHIWPYLEGFAAEANQLVSTELLGKPDLVIGHYTDGNLVAYLLSKQLGATHCACVHALEKTKYLLSDLHWADMEQQYHFSLQYTADLIAYNSADFILSSSFREVGGTADEMGMIEAYDLFTMPGLYRVRSGLDPRLARHNIVPPGVSEEFFFPNHETDRRVTAIESSLLHRFFDTAPHGSDVGHLDDVSRPPVFAMARMDRIKNLSGLVEIFGKSGELRENANLLLVTSVNQLENATDAEEHEEVRRTYELIDEYELEGSVRWCAARLDKSETGEIYRIAADRYGVFAQPAFMETFGLTVIEAMACGLPVVVTCFGGPSEIVVDGVSGFVADPNDAGAFAQAMLRVLTDSKLWAALSEAGVSRVIDAFTWDRHATRVLKLANVHEYWNHLDVMNRQALDRYLHTLYHTVYRPRTLAMLQGE